jgi:chorismate mutase/prephenate dehydratase
MAVIDSPRSVAFQGEHGAYSEQAAFTYFGSDIETKPHMSLREVFRSVERGAVECGVVPAENSLEGSINQTYDLLLESDLKIQGEIKMKISHCLLALPGTRLANLAVVYSHPQALAQCAGFLDTLHVETVPAYDTAGSAKMIKDKQIRDAAAIASKYSAEVYGLTILKTHIEDLPDNFTRMFVIGTQDAPATGNDKTSIVFGTKHVPGSLQNALRELATRKINLTKIESRPTRTTPWEYYFFVDFEGHRSSPMCADALEALENATTFLKVLGSYPSAA